MTIQAHTSQSVIWPTTLAGFIGGFLLIFAVVVAGPADADVGPTAEAPQCAQRI